MYNVQLCDLVMHTLQFVYRVQPNRIMYIGCTQLCKDMMVLVHTTHATLYVCVCVLHSFIPRHTHVGIALFIEVLPSV